MQCDKNSNYLSRLEDLYIFLCKHADQEGAEWRASSPFMANFSLRESLLTECGSLPIVIATQTWEVQ